MPNFNVTGPDGKTYRVEAPAGATQRDAIAYVADTYYGGGATPSAPLLPPIPAAPAPVAKPQEEEGFLSAALKRGVPLFKESVAKVIEEVPAIAATTLNTLRPGSVISGTDIFAGLGALAPQLAPTYKDITKGTVEGLRKGAKEDLARLGPGQYGSFFEEQGFGRKLGSLAETVAESALPVGAGLATGLLTRSPTAAGLVMGVGSAPMTYSGIRERQEKEGIDDIQRAVIGTAASSALDVLTGIGGKVLSGTAALAAREILEGGIKQALVRTAKSGGEEALTESLQNVVEQVAGGTNPATKQAMLETIEAGLAGGLGGTVFGGTSELVTAPFRSRNKKAIAQQVASSPQGIAEFQRLAMEEVGQVMQANPGMSRNDAVALVEQNAEQLRLRAVANILGAEGEADVDTGMDVGGGGGAGFAPNLEPGAAPVGAGELGEAVTGRLGEPVPSVPVPDVGAGAGIPALDLTDFAPTIEAIQEAPDNKTRKPLAMQLVSDVVQATPALQGLGPKAYTQAANQIVLAAARGTAFDPVAIVAGVAPKAKAAPKKVPGVSRTTVNINGQERVIETPTTSAGVQQLGAELGAIAPEAQLTPEAQPTPTVAETATVEKVAPEWAVENARGVVEALQRANPELLNVVTDLHAKDLTAAEISNETGLGVDIVRDVRLGLGLPDQGKATASLAGTGTPEDAQQRAAFEQWRDEYNAKRAPEAQAPSITPEPQYTPQQVLENIDEFARTEAQDRDLDPDMFLNGVADIREGREPLGPVEFAAQFGFTAPGEKLRFSIEERPVDIAYGAYKAGTQFAQDRIAEAAKPVEGDTYEGVLAEAQKRHDEGKLTPQGLQVVQERVEAAREAQAAGLDTRYTPDAVRDALDRMSEPEETVNISVAGDPVAEGEYMTDAVHEAAESILQDFMVGDRVRVGSSPGIVVGLDGDYLRVHPDTARNPKAYNRVPKSSVTFVSRPDTATTVSASKVEGEDAKFGTEDGQLNADMAGLIQLLGANMYAANVADVSVKELLQNAFDAVKGAVSGKKMPSLYKDGQIEITLNSNERTITIKDNARGMTPEIVRDAFFTVAGSDKSDLDPSERSGGLGLAKMGFMMGADWLKLDTVRDGVRVTVDATSKEIAGSDFKIVKSPAAPGEHGTTVTVKIPETYTDPKTGDQKNIWFPYSADSVGILTKPLIGPVAVQFTYDRGYGDPETKMLPLGVNFPYDDYQKLEATFEWGKADIYYGKNREKYPSHQVLSSGVYQFDERFKLNQNDTIPYNIIVDVKPAVEAKHPDYPFENSRERFKGRLKADIDSLGLYLAKIARGAEAADLKETMQNVVSLPRIEAGEDVKGLEGKLKKSFEKGQGPAKELPALPTEVTISDLGVFDLGGRTVVDSVKEAEKKKASTFEAATEAPTRDDFMIELDQDPRNPIFHNNTNFDPIEVGTPYGEPAKFFAELGSLLVEMKELLATSGRWKYDELSPDNMFYAGIAIDKQYGGLHTRVPYKALLLNPFYDWGARTLLGVRANLLNTMIHEVAHTGNMNHGVGHNNEIISVEQYLADEGMLDYFRDAIMDTLLRHESTFTAMREAYGRSTTQNIAKSLEDYGDQGSASQQAGGTGDGSQDANGPVPAGGGRGRRGDLQTAASANPEGEERGGTGGGTEPLTEENVDKAVSVKLTKAQMRRLEAAAGLRRKDLNNMQKRIVQSRNSEETLSLIGKLTKIAQQSGETPGILASLMRSMPPAAYKFLLGFQQIETVFSLARIAKIKSLEKIDDMMRNGYIPYVNRIVVAADKISRDWADFASRDAEGNVALDDAIMISNMLDVDPSTAPTAAEYMRRDKTLLDLQSELASEKDPAKQKSLKGQITSRKDDIQRVYFGGVLRGKDGKIQKDEAGNPIEVRGWNDVPPDGRRIFKAARDFHRASFKEHYRLLMQRIDDAGFDEADAARVKGAITKMFAKAGERTIYFPVKRFGEYWLSVGDDFYMRESLSEINALAAHLKKKEPGRPISMGEGRENLRKKVASNDASGALKGILDLLDEGNAQGQITDINDLRDLVFQMYLTSLPEADMRRRFIHREFTTGFSTDALRTFATSAVASANQLGRLAYNYKFQNQIEEAKKETEYNPMKPWLDTITAEVKMKVDGVMSPQTNDMIDAIIAFAGKLTFFNLLSAPSSAFMNLTQLHIVGLPVLSAEFGEAKTANMAARYTASFLAGREIPNPFRDEDGNIGLQAPEFRFENSAYMRGLKENNPERYKQTLAAWDYAREHDVIESTFSAGANLYERSNVPTGDFTFTQALRRGEVVTAAQRATANAINGLGYMFHKSEVIGRSIMYMSSFDLAYERAINEGKTPEEAGREARELATKLTNKGMFDFSNWNKSRFAQSRVGRLALQMQSYRQSMNMLLLRSFVRMLPYFNKEGKLAAARVFFGVAGMTALYGGLRVTHLSAMAMAAYTVLKYVESLFDDDDEEEEIKQGYLNENTVERELLKFADEKGNELSKKDMEYYLRSQWINETFGKGSTFQNALGLSDETAAKLAKVADMGLPALGGVDLSNSVALNEFWTPVEAKGNTPEVRALEMLARWGLGPTASTLASYVKAAQAWQDGDINKAFETMLPAAIRNYIKSERLQSEGLRVGKNEDIILKEPDYYTNGKAALQAFGFRDAETSRNMQLDIAAGKIEDEISKEQTKLLDKRYRAILDFEQDPSEKNEREWNRIEREIDIYNLNYPSNAITKDTKKRSLKAKRAEAADKAYGLGYDPDIPIRMPLVEERAAQMEAEQ